MTSTFGRKVGLVTLLLRTGSSFTDTMTRTTAWTTPPVIEFAGGATWISILDPANTKVAVFTQTRAAVAARIDGEAWLIRDVTTDEVLVSGKVLFQT
jgi:hypothetical protein